MHKIHIKRIYEDSNPQDGFRVLVDRVWPRGISKEKAQTDVWMKSVAPSTTLRKWFGHEPDKWEEFKSRYHAELDGKPEEISELLQQLREGTVTLLFSARDIRHNQARALQEYLLECDARRKHATRGPSLKTPKGAR